MKAIQLNGKNASHLFLNGKILWQAINKDFRIEYTIEETSSSYKLNRLSSISGYYYLPFIDNNDVYSLDYLDIKIKLINGTTTRDINVLAKDVESVIVYYDEDKITKMRMPLNLKELHYINISNFTSFQDMFYNCSKLTSLDLSSWDTSKITNMKNMFGNCKNLTSLNVSSFNTGRVDDIWMMFYNIPEITDWGYDENDPNSYSKFYHSESSTAYNYTFPWDNSDLFHVTYTIVNTTEESLNSGSNYIGLPKIGTNYNYDYTNNIEITLLDGSITRDITTPCNQVLSIKLKYPSDTKLFTFPELVKTVEFIEPVMFTKMSFNLCSSLTSINTSNWGTFRLNNMSYMFDGCTSLTSLDLSSFDTSKVTNMSNMFENCSSLTSLDLSNFDTSNVTNMMYMFNGCSSLTSLDLSNFNTSNVKYMSGMFSGCSSLSSLQVSNFDTSNVTDMSSMFSSCSGISKIDLSTWDTSKVTNMSVMFGGSNIERIGGISNWNTSKVTTMYRMFYDCRFLEQLDLSKWNISSVTNMEKMFWSAGLKYLDMSTWNTSNVSNSEQMLNFHYEDELVINFNYDKTNPNSYSKWTLTEEETGFEGTFPWNE